MLYGKDMIIRSIAGLIRKMYNHHIKMSKYFPNFHINLLEEILASNWIYLIMQQK